MNILDPKFRYVPAAKTNIRRTFERIRREQKERDAKAAQVVRPIIKAKGAK